MKRLLVLIVISLFISEVSMAQMSLKEERQMKRYYNAGVEQMSAQSFNNALNSFSSCLEIDASNALAYLNRAKVFYSLGLIDECYADLDMSIQHDPKLGEAHFYKGYFLTVNLDDTSGMAKSHLEQSVELGFEVAEVYYYLGLLSLLEGDSDLALIMFNKALVLKDDYVIALHDRAGIKSSLGDYNGALYDYKTAVNYQEVFPQAYNNMGVVKIVLGDYTGALEDFVIAIEQDSSNFMAHNNRGYAYYQLGDMELALNDFESALELQSVFIEAQLNKAAALAGSNELSASIAQFDLVIEENPKEALLYLNRGLVRELQGDVIGACEDWSKALELGDERASEYLEECK